MAQGASLEWPTKEWQTSSPEQQGMDSSALADLVKFGASNQMDSLLVTRHGKLVAEAYYAPFKAGIKHRINSATKAVISTLIAIALKDGLLDSLDRRVLEFFPDRKIDHLDDRKQAITIQHLLDMTSGLDWAEPLDDTPPVSLFAMERSQDWQQFILDRPISREPGTDFNYDSGNAHLLSAIITKLTGGSARSYADAQLFGPLGITDVDWPQDPQGISTGGRGLYLQPRDMAKIGYLYLRNGVWGGRQILPPAWIDKVNHASVDMHQVREPDLRYGNLFWALPDKKVYMAVGFHRQLIVVMPAIDVVAVVTGTRHYAFAKLVAAIADAVKSDQPLAANPPACSLLDISIADAATEKPSAVGQVPDLAKAISGKVYHFAPNKLNLNTLSLNLVGTDASFEWVGSTEQSTSTTERITRPIGVDGYYRTGGHARYGIPAAKGNWQDQKTFVLELLTLGNDDARKITLTFEGSGVDLKFQSAGFQTEAQGRTDDLQ